MTEGLSKGELTPTKDRGMLRGICGFESHALRPTDDCTQLGSRPSIT